MSARYGLVYPLWAGELGCDDLLDRALGEVGVDFVIVPIATGPLLRLAPWRPAPPASFRTRGGWQISLRGSSHAGSLKRIPQSGWFGKRDLLRPVLEQLAARRLPAIARIDLRSAAVVRDHGEHLSMVNAWGETEPGRGACVLSAELRELLQAAVALAREAGFDACEIVDWRVDRAAGNTNRNRPLSWSPAVRELLDVCFCAACRQAADEEGIDAEQVARSVRVHAQRAVLDPVAAIAAELDADELLVRYRRTRSATCDAWLERLARQHASGTLFHLCDSAPDRASSPAPEAVETVLRAADESALNAARAICVPAWRPRFAHGDDLVRYVLDSQDHGVLRFEFDDLDAAPAEALQWVRQAVRFARRRQFA